MCLFNQEGTFLPVGMYSVNIPLEYSSILYNLSNGISYTTYLSITGHITGFLCDETFNVLCGLGATIGIFDPALYVWDFRTGSSLMVSCVNVTRPSRGS